MRRLIPLLLLLTACSPATGSTDSTTSELPSTQPPVSTAPPATTSTSTTTTTTSTTTTAAPVVAAEPALREIFAWMPKGLIDGFPELVAAIPGVDSVSVITSVTMHLSSSHKADGTAVDQPPSGFVIPLHGATVDSEGLELVYGLPRIAEDELVLGDESAALRRLAVGDTITFETGSTLTVGAIVDESQMAGYEAIAIDPTQFDAARAEARAMLVLYEDSPVRLELEIAPRLKQLDPDVLFAVRERSKSADRGGLVVRSQVFIKQNFGEFAYRPTGGGRFVIDPGWVSENIVDQNIPLLGQAKCHKVTTEILTNIMQDLIDNGLSDVIEKRRFAGCWNARYIAGSTRLSRHSFGAAVDINFFNPTDGGPGSPVNPELLSRMFEAGMTSGHLWTNADPGHFEYFGFPEDE
ncbi:MAG: M15 family metallopeptidase [Acidimicrobiia bacterium]|nr:M15 family metallopeptidase [Acidimicrobiia bacterium]